MKFFFEKSAKIKYYVLHCIKKNIYLCSIK